MSIIVKDGNNSNVTLKSTTDTGEEVPHHIVDGVVTVTGAVSTGLSQPLTDAQLRGSAVNVSQSSQPLPIGAATEATLVALNNKVPAAGQNTMANSQPVVIASNQTAIPVSENSLILTGQSGQTATVNNILESVAGSAATNVENFRSMTVQVVSTGTAGTFIFEQSNDNVNFVALPVFNAALVTGVPITAAITASASQIIYTFPLRTRFVRLRIASTITGGSIQAFSRISTEPWTAAAQLVASNTAANLNATIASPTIAASTNLIGDVGQQYRANATGAGTPTPINSPATPAAQSIKASAGRVLSVYAVNSNASARFLKVFNTASPTIGTTPALYEIPIPPSNNPALIKLEGGIEATAAIVICVTGARGLTDATPITLNDVTGFIVHR